MHRDRDRDAGLAGEVARFCRPRFSSGNKVAAGIQDSASSATLCALLAARERAINSGAALERPVRVHLYRGDSSVQKRAHVAGFSPSQVRLVVVDDAFRMDPAALGGDAG